MGGEELVEAWVVLGDGESRGAGELGCNGDGMLRYAERETGSCRPEAISIKPHAISFKQGNYSTFVLFWEGGEPMLKYGITLRHTDKKLGIYKNGG